MLAAVSSRVVQRNCGPSTRKTQRRQVATAFQCPYSTLGVSSTADETQIKKAYRKLALEWHPDVSKHEGSQVVFLQLTEAYEFLMGKVNGKEGKEPSSADWEFHDWYWNFRVSRTWGKQQAGSPDKPPPNGSRPAGSSSSQRANIREQLAGLRHRAAVRSTKARSSASGSSLDEEPVPVDVGSQVPGAGQAAGPSGPGSSAGHTSSMTASEDAEAACASGAVSAGDSMAGSGTEGASWFAAGPGSRAQGDSGDEGERDASAEEEAPSGLEDAAAGASTTRRKFVPDTGTREQVMSQLAGLRRKAVMSKQL